MCLILADFEIFWVCVGGSVSFVLRFWKTMELRITSTTLDPHSDSVWPRTRACRPCDEGWCPWKQHFGVVNFLVFGFRDWILMDFDYFDCDHLFFLWFWRTSWLTKGHLEGQLIFFRDQTSTNLGELTWRGAWGSRYNKSVGFRVHFQKFSLDLIHFGVKQLTFASWPLDKLCLFFSHEVKAIMALLIRYSGK